MRLSSNDRAALEEKMESAFNEHERKLYDALIAFGTSHKTAWRITDEARKESFLLDRCLCPRCYGGLVIFKRDGSFNYFCPLCSNKFQRTVDRS